MRHFTIALLCVAGLLGFTASPAEANDVSSLPTDPSNASKHVEERRAQRDSLLGVSPLKSIHCAAERASGRLYKSTCLKMNLAINHAFQGMSDARPGKHKSGTATDMDIYGTWEIARRGRPSRGNLYFAFEGRWDYGTIGPQDLGFVSLGSQIGTANTYSAYTPAWLLRNFYWEQGSKKAGWAFRIGKISPDAILATSRHISPVATFLPNGGTGLFVSGYCDSGLGAVGVVYPCNRIRILALISDANGDRQNWGDVTAGDYYKAVELGVQIAPRTKKAGYSKITFWHTDGTKDGKPINASTGVEGYGVTVKLEQELTRNGNLVGVVRWGKSWDKSSLYDDQAAAHLLLYDPPGPARLKNDLLGVALNYAQASASGARPEYNVEVFYRFPLFVGVDTTLSYQSVINPALGPEVDHASVFSLRLRAVF